MTATGVPACQNRCNCFPMAYEGLLQEELTALQRETLIAYYFQEQNIPQIAADRGVNKSTVSRTLRRAEEKLRRYLKY